VLRRVDRIRAFQEERHPAMPLSEFALRFCLSHPAVGTVIPGIRSFAQAEANVKASDGVPIERAELKEMEQFAWRKDFWHCEVEA